MVKLHEKYVTDERGKKTAVVLDIKVYLKLRECLEDLQDALDFKKAEASSKRFKSLEELQKRLKA